MRIFCFNEKGLLVITINNNNKKKTDIDLIKLRNLTHGRDGEWGNGKYLKFGFYFSYFFNFIKILFYALFFLLFNFLIHIEQENKIQ